MKRALIVVDVQNDFLPGGALAVPNGDTILPVVTSLIETCDEYSLVVVTQDFHPKDHGSFASVHEGAEPFEEGELAGLPQMFWPDHCVQGTSGVRLSAAIEKAIRRATDSGLQILSFKKGQDRDVDSYSAFFDNARRHDTGLHRELSEHGIEEVDVVGLAFDYCVRATALDAASLNYKTRILMQGTRPVDPSSEERVKAELSRAGVLCVTR